MEFKEWFCLKNRESFIIDAKVNPTDARFYFGRDEIKRRIQNQLKRSFIEPGIPKMIVYGSYGSGKTQTLYYMQHFLQKEMPGEKAFTICPVHVDLEMRSKSDHYHWHLQLMEKLGRETVTKWIENLIKRSLHINEEVKAIFGDLNLVEAVPRIREGGDIGFAAWRWLCGQPLPTRELEQLKVTRNLGQTGSGDLVNAMVGIGKLAEVNSEKIVFFMDEAEQFHNVTAHDAVQYLHDYVRKLSERANSTVGFVISSYGLTVDDMPSVLSRPDIRQRIKEINIIHLPPLPSIKDVQIFLKELLSELVDRPKAEAKIHNEGLGVALDTYPLNSAAFDRLCDYALADPAKCLPRNIINALNESCITAWDEGKAIVDENIIDEIAPLVFG